jgi:hypothetical protein
MSDRDVGVLEAHAPSPVNQGIFDRDISDPASRREVAQQRAKLTPVEHHGFPCAGSLLPAPGIDSQTAPRPSASSEDPTLPGLPPPLGGCRQIIHIQPAKYIDIPYPEDYSVRHGITIGHKIIQVPGWFPGAHNYGR